MDERRFTDADGVDVFYRSWPTGQPLQGVLVVVHGASEHSGRYARFADALNQMGYSVFAPDHRGHGGTAESTGRGLTGPRGLSGILDDLEHVVELAHKVANDRPVILFGHSMGSIFALRYAQARPSTISALILSGPIGVMPGVAEMIPHLEGAVAAGMADTPAPDALASLNAAFEPSRTPFDWLSRDEAEVDAYLADPLCGAGVPLSLGYLLAMSQGLRDSVADADALPDTLPVLIMAGERDPVSAFTDQSRQLAEALRTAGVAVTEQYYPDARHELLNETNREDVYADIAKWLDDAAGAPQG